MNHKPFHISSFSYDPCDSLRGSINAAAALIARGKSREGYQMLQQVTAGAVPCIIPTFPYFCQSSLIGKTCRDEQQQQQEALSTDVNVRMILVTDQQQQDVNVIGTSFLYPFLVVDTTIQPEQLNRIYAVAWYNMAVACHRQALCHHDCKQRHEQLLLARYWFEQSELYMADIVSSEPDGSLMQVYLALCNNLVEIAMEFGDLVHVQYWQRSLLSALQVVPPRQGCFIYQHFHSMGVFYLLDVVAARTA